MAEKAGVVRKVVEPNPKGVAKVTQIPDGVAYRIVGTGKRVSRVTGLERSSGLDAPEDLDEYVQTIRTMDPRRKRKVEFRRKSKSAEERTAEAWRSVGDSLRQAMRECDIRTRDDV